jgi:hypothetical protein
MFDTIQLCLEIEPALQTQAWQQSRSFATAESRWNAYLNQLCLQTLLPWFQEDEPQAAPAPNVAALPSFWEWVNGTAIRLGNTRLALIPTEAIDTDELRVPQEWVDIPNWVADYYLAVQVNPDEQWVRVNGFTTHRQLKTLGAYDWHDRTYTLAETDLTPDLNALTIARQLNLSEPTRAPVESIAPVPLNQAQTLIQRLGDSSLSLQPSAVSFPTWAALLQHSGWRKQLTERRQGLPQRSIAQWLQAGVSTLAQWGWERIELQPSAIGARGTEQAGTVIALAQRLSIANQPCELRIIPGSSANQRVWRFELENLTPGGQIPAGVTLRLLTEDLQPFAGNEDVATTPVDRLYIEVTLELGEGLVWEIDPTPASYDPEILRF